MGLSRARAIPTRAQIGERINLAALAAVLIWSGVAPFAKYALAQFPWLAFTALRPLIAAVLLFGLLRLRGVPLGIPAGDRGRLALGGLGLGLSQLCFIGGLAHTSVAHGVILFSTSPLLQAVVRWATRQNAPDPRTLFGIVMGLAGVGLLVSGAGGGNGATLTGDALSLLAALAWLAVTVVPAPLVVRHGSVRITAWLTLTAALVTVPLAFGALTATVAAVPSPLAWAALLYGAVLGVLVANTLWQRAVHSGGATQALVYLYLEPVGALALAALLLGERLGLLQALGGALALIGVGLVQRPGPVLAESALVEELPDRF